MRPMILVLAKAAIAAAPRAEMAALAEAVAAHSPGHNATYAFSEQGSPSLRERLSEIAASGVSKVIIVPAMLPMEPGFPAWIRRAVNRWMKTQSLPLPKITIAPPPLVASSDMPAILSSAVARAGHEDVTQSATPIPDASVIQGPKRRVLLCMGGPCNDAASGLLWQHLRAEQDRLGLRDNGEGMMSCKTSCLGPCNLAPVVQVWPEGTTYCGVDETALDRILAEHIQGGTPVEDLAYRPQKTKQRLRS
ncbi:(2Fe-2S) ferredoxin domain-containing protein [Yoonia sp. MH D7]